MGQVLATKGGRLRVAPAASPAVLAESDQLVASIRSWVSDAAGDIELARRAGQLEELATALGHRHARDEAVLLLNAVTWSYSRPVADLAAWLRGVEHLRRRGEEWLAENGDAADLADVAQRLRIEVDRI